MTGTGLSYLAKRHEHLPHVVKFSGGRSSGMMLFRLLEEGLLDAWDPATTLVELDIRWGYFHSLFDPGRLASAEVISARRQVRRATLAARSGD